MAIYHLRVKFVQRSKGKSSVASAAYRSCEKIKDEHTGRTWDYSNKGDLDHKEILLPDHVDDRLADRSTLWNTVEAGLKRKDGQPAFECEVALPRELDKAQCVQLVRDFANEQFVKQGLIVDFAIHRPPASDGGEHPHAHMLITTRRWNNDGSMAKVARDMQDSPALLQKVYALEDAGKIDEALLVAKGTNLAEWRKAWADYSNDFLSDSGSASRIDHRTLAAQKIDREATPNIGFAFYREVKGLAGRLADRVREFKAVGWRNAMRSQFERIHTTRKDLTAEFIANAREHAAELLEGLGLDEREKGLDHER
jgi:hypothetical protein